MPTYKYKCKCGNNTDIFHGINEKPEVPCGICKETMQRAITSGGSGGFVKGITAVKYWKEDRLHAKKRANLEVKQLERYSRAYNLVPNFNGEETSSWGDAAKRAKESGSSTTKYEELAAKEKRTANSAKVDESKLKAAKEKARLVY